MTPGLTSVIIPTYQHATHLREAINSALDQTAPVEVLVIDDGSTDNTSALMASIGLSYPDRVRYIRIDHAGPSAARNRGIDEARGEFVMFLDADDVISPMKVELQLAAMTPEIGWVLCDVHIEDEAMGRAMNASQQYGYASMDLGGWIPPLLKARSFIPIMSPLVRRAILEAVLDGAWHKEIRFRDDRVPEDWYFWQEVAGVARCRYVPEVLATYRHRRTGRSRLPKAARAVSANVEMPLRLNLGCGRKGTSSWHPIAGMVNLDKTIDGWTIENRGLADFLAGSVAGVSVSHLMMYVPIEHWPSVFREFARVLAPGGVVRITEDDAFHPRSANVGGWKGSEPAVTLTNAAMLIAALERAGLAAREVDAETTGYVDRSLMQAHHGKAPTVCFVEGVRVPGVLFSPHSDDECLYASWTILRHRPAVVIAFPSERDYGSTEVRLAESRDACAILGATGVEQWQGGDLVAQMWAYDQAHHPARVWAPDRRASHSDHVAVAVAAAEVFGPRLTTYHTYIGTERVRDGKRVEYELEWVQAKLRALARYESQLRHPRAHVFFTQDLAEYLGTERMEP